MLFEHEDGGGIGRAGGLAGAFDSEGDEMDVVELEKSNVLLMGPTGSGWCNKMSPWRLALGWMLFDSVKEKMAIQIFVSMGVIIGDGSTTAAVLLL